MACVCVSDRLNSNNWCSYSKNYISSDYLLAVCFSQGFAWQPSWYTSLKLTEGHWECFIANGLGLCGWQQKSYFNIVITSSFLFFTGFSQQPRWCTILKTIYRSLRIFSLLMAWVSVGESFFSTNWCCYSKNILPYSNYLCFSQGISQQPSWCTILKLTEGHC